jgi:hypothetical protein
MQPLGKMLVLFGAIMIIVGAMMMFSDKIPYLGKLPGDINIKKDNFQVFIPITTSIILSIFLSLILWAISYLNKK